MNRKLTRLLTVPTLIAISLNSSVFGFRPFLYPPTISFPDALGNKPVNFNSLIFERSSLNELIGNVQPDTLSAPTIEAFPDVPKPNFSVNSGLQTRTDVASGLSTTTFDTLEGTVTVNLPDDLAAGDTISGSVIAEPKGKTGDEQAKNQDELSGYVVEVANQSTPKEKVTGNLIDFCKDPAQKPDDHSTRFCSKWSVPDEVKKVAIVLKNREGKTVSRAEVPVAPKVNPAKVTEGLLTPAVGQAGKPVAVKGSFDGDFTNTKIKFGNKIPNFLASSPRIYIVQSPKDLKGVTEIEIANNGKTVASCTYRSVSVKLAADKLNLIKGEQTTLTVTLAGLIGLLSPVAVQLSNKSPGTISLDGGDTQTLNVNPAEVSSDSFSAKRTLTGISAGGFSVNAIVQNGGFSVCSPRNDGIIPQPSPPIPTPTPTPTRPPDQGSNWDFEEGLTGWIPTGDAFENQPTRGDNVLAARVRMDMTLERGGIGGDYWKRVPYPIGHHLKAWIGTFENHPQDSVPPLRNTQGNQRTATVTSSDPFPLGEVQGDGKTGTLTSGNFPLDNEHRFISFVVGGGSDTATERVEFQVRGENDADVAALERIVRDGRGDSSAIATRDGNYVVAFTASGQNSEVMRTVIFDVPTTLRGRWGRIRIVDNSGDSWGHINADDFRFAAGRPTDRPRPVWGFADTHAHPMNDLSFGGNVVQGSLYARDGSSFASERYRRTALPPMFESVTDLGALGALLTPFYGPLARTSLSGYPNLQGYPSFNQMLGQQMYGEWVRRAYDGGLRLMSALAVNNWVASSHPIKRRLLGSTAPEDDKLSAEGQIRDITAWTLRPENRGWVEVAFTPADARRIISANKLAIVIGCELDVLGNFVPNNHWTETGVSGAIVIPPEMPESEKRSRIAAELDRLNALGVRQVGAFHYVSGVFGGTAMWQRLFNDVNRRITGDNVHVVSGNADGIRYRLDEDSWEPPNIISRGIVTGPDGLPHMQSDSTWFSTPLGHMNRMGLTRAGEILFEEMTRRGMIIDIDHASSRSSDRLLQLATERDYPMLSSHTDFMDLGFTGPGDFTHTLPIDNDGANFRHFGTTILDPLRKEGMLTRSKAETISRLGGVTGPVLWLPRRISWGDAVPNDCDGSTKTWAQSYQYAVDIMGGRGVALSTDRITVYPRFGPNSAYLLGIEHDAMSSPSRDERRFAQVDAQRNGVRYDVPISEWHAFRFGYGLGGKSAWQKTPLGFGWEEKFGEHEDAWKAIAAVTAGRNPRTMPDHGGIEPSGDPFHSGRIIDYAWGLSSENEADLVSDCPSGGCDRGIFNERYAAYCVKKNITPEWRDASDIPDHYRWVKTVWDEWQRMSGSNAPLRRHVFGNRDFDVNIDGVAHYGMLPDLLQDVANSHPRPAEVGTYLDPLFRSAESYIQMWEKSRRIAGLDR